MAGTLVTVATYALVPQAELAKVTLEEAGVPAVLGDDGIMGADWLMGNAVGDVKVQVREEDAARAAEVLRDLGDPVETVDEDELTRQALAAGDPDAEEDAPADDAP